MRQLSLGASLLVLAATQYGCSPFGMAKRGFTELRGAHGDVCAVTAAPPGFHEGLSGINIGEVGNTIEPICSPEMHRRIEAALRREAAKASEEMDGENGPCTVDVDIVFNKEPGGAMALVGKGAVLIGRAAVRGPDGTPVADLLIRVASKAVRTTADEMADEFAQTLVARVRQETG